MKNSNWSLIVSGQGDDSTALNSSKEIVETMRRGGHKVNDARFILQSAADSRQSIREPVDLLTRYSENSVPTPPEVFGTEASA